MTAWGRAWALPAVLALAFGLYGWAKVAAVGLGYDGTIGPYYNALGCDWAIFHTAIRGVWDGAPIYDQLWLKQTLNTTLAYWLSAPMPFPAFHYPPVYLLALAPFTALPFAASYWAFQGATYAVMLVALHRFARNTQAFLFYAVLLSASPAASNGVMAGQNGFLTCALFLFAAAWQKNRPPLSGAMLGLLSFKPQLALMVPFALIGERRWRMCAGAVLAVVAAIGVSVAVFGAGVWDQWFALLLHPRRDIASTGIDWGRMWDNSVFSVAVRFGAGRFAADGFQALAAAGCGAVVWRVYKKSYTDEIRLAVLLTATTLAAPHLSGYDMLLSTLAGLVFVRRALTAGLSPPAWVLLIWALPFFGPPKTSWSGVLVPAILIYAIAVMLTNRTPNSNQSR